MPLKNNKEPLSFLNLYEKFFNDSKRGKRLQPNGKRISPGTAENYNQTLLALRRFSIEKNFTLRIKPVHRLNSREKLAERNYWKKFYKRFTDYLYDDCGYFDNYSGSLVKNLRVFFNYLNKELGLGIGEFHKLFFVRKEEIAIFPLLPEELNFLIYNKEFDAALKPGMREVKDFFVFGCTVALRFSDLAALKKTNLRIVNEQYYLAVRSIKTSKDTLIKLPAYAVSIINRYDKIKKRLLPKFTLTGLNKFVKILLEKAGYTDPVYVTRSRRGVNPIPTSQYPTPAKRPAYSAFDKTKIQETFGIELKDWKSSLAVCLKRLNGIKI